MRQHKAHNFLITTSVAMLAIVIIITILSHMISLADYSGIIPAPTYTPPEEIIMSRGEAPAQNREGLTINETFDEALERVKSSIPDELVELAGHAIWGEAGNVPSTARQAAVLWVACNRVDAWGKTFDEVLVGSQFNGLWETRPAPEAYNELARDVLARWALEHEGWQDVGRTIAPEYLYFYGDGHENIYTVKMHRGAPWDWSLIDPYNGETGAEVSF